MIEIHHLQSGPFRAIYAAGGRRRVFTADTRAEVEAHLDTLAAAWDDGWTARDDHDPNGQATSRPTCPASPESGLMLRS